jgi:ATP-binding cassette subfamily B protein
MTIGTVYLLVAYMNMLDSPLTQIHRQLHHLQRAIAGATRVRAFLQLRPAVQDLGTAPLPDAAPAVAFQDVTFAYKDRPEEETTPTVLEDVSFAARPGQVLGVLGRTGSGKTTLTRLLFRLYDVDEGAITLDGVDVRATPLANLHGHIGLVTQDVELFAATVRDNLTLFRNYDSQATPIADETLLATLEAVGLKEWLDGLPQGLDTPLAGGGKGLSAGEAQLLALARVFLRDPQVVVLDEASSRLDPGTEQRLEQAIDRLLAGRTGLIIAHRLRTVLRADQILILEDGRVTEFGERAALAADPDSRFSQLLQTGLTEVLA